MSLSRFIEQDIDTTNKFSILVVPNITSQRELEKDSYVLVMENVIRELNKIRDDLFFHLPITEFSERLDFPNTKQYIITMPSFPNSMRIHYDFYQWNKILKSKDIEYDLIWSHLPEQTTNIKNHIHNVWGTDVPVIGYSHWIENSEFAPNWKVTTYHNNISGMLQMEKCGINTRTQKRALIEECKEYYSQKVIDDLERIITPLYLGIEDSRINDSVITETNKVIVFNHRCKEYRGWKKFLQLIQKLDRDDITVFASMADATAIQQVKGMGLEHLFDFDGPDSREEYIEKLSNCRVGFHAGTRWAMSSQDGLCRGVPYVFEKGLETGELFGDKLETGFENWDDALDLINRMLDDDDFRNKQSQFALEHCRGTHSWSSRILAFNDFINKSMNLGLQDVISKGEKKLDILEHVKQKGMITSKELSDYLGWGRQIGFRRYRNFLREQGVKTIYINKQEHYYHG